MFAIIKTGGKQYKVSKGDKIWVEKLNVQPGEKISINDVLMVNDGKEIKIGSPLVEKALVEFKVVDQIRDDKIIVFKKKRRQNYRRKNGHRQHQTILMVEGISLSGKALATDSVPGTSKSSIDTGSAEKKAPAKSTIVKAEAAPKTTKGTVSKKETSKAPIKKPASKKPTEKK